MMKTMKMMPAVQEILAPTLAEYGYGVGGAAMPLSLPVAPYDYPGIAAASSRPSAGPDGSPPRAAPTLNKLAQVAAGSIESLAAWGGAAGLRVAEPSSRQS